MDTGLLIARLVFGLLNGALYAPWLAFPLPESVLGSRFEPPPASLPVPEPPPPGVPLFRVDDRGQGLLFEA